MEKHQNKKILLGTGNYGPTDLDTRPAESERSTKGMWVSECLHSGYVAGDIKDELIINKDFLEPRFVQEH